MWIIVANKGLNLHRDNRIAELIGDVSSQEYLTKTSGNKKYHTTSNINWSQVFKTESGAMRIIQEFNYDINKSSYSNKFNWVREYVLSIRKMTREEWESLCDFEMSKLKNKYDRQLSKLNKKKLEYK